MAEYVEIILCTKDGRKYLQDQIESLLSQTYPYICIHVFDDGSRDGTRELLRHYAAKYPFFHYAQNPTPLGVVKNFERAIASVEGSLYALCDQDDLWHPRKIERQVEAIGGEKGPAMVHSDLEMIDERGRVVEPSFFKAKGYAFVDQKAVDILISRSGVMGNTILFNKALKRLILPFFSPVPMHDYYIGVINELFGRRITIREPLVGYRIHRQNLGNPRRSFLERIRRFFTEPLPYRDREPFLRALLERDDLEPRDKEVIREFLECIRRPCLRRRRFYKERPVYRLKLFARYLLHGPRR